MRLEKFSKCLNNRCCILDNPDFCLLFISSYPSISIFVFSVKRKQTLIFLTFASMSISRSVKFRISCFSFIGNNLTILKVIPFINIRPLIQSRIFGISAMRIPQSIQTSVRPPCDMLILIRIWVRFRENLMSDWWIPKKQVTDCPKVRNQYG